jgi:hypothetical protein
VDAARHRDRHGTLRPKSFERWRRLTLLAQGRLPDQILLEDANDLALFLEATGRTVPRFRWCEEAIDEQNEQFAESFF